MTGLPKDCPKCGHKMHECIAAEKRQRNGWYCEHCRTFVKATGRERFLAEIEYRMRHIGSISESKAPYMAH